MRRRASTSVRFLQAALLFSIAVTTTSCGESDWTIELVAGGGLFNRDMGMFSSIALDSADYAHISHFDANFYDLYYETNASGKWVQVRVDGGGIGGKVGYTTSIVVDASDYVHISYMDLQNTNLKYATNASGQWTNVNADSGGDVGLGSSIAVDSAGKAHISYCDDNDILKYASNVTGIFLSENVDGDAPGCVRTSIALDSSDKVHISYYTDLETVVAPAKLKYATNASGSWVAVFTNPTSLDTQGWGNSLALIDSNNIIISHYNASESRLQLMVFFEEMRRWRPIYVDDTVGGVATYAGSAQTSIALDNSDQMHISYYDRTNETLKYATGTSGSWVFSSPDPAAANVGLFSSMALDSAGAPHISYYDGTNGNLKYATPSGLALLF